MKTKQLKELSKNDLNKKMQELRFELVKSQGNSQKSSGKIKEIKKTIARIHTINKSNEELKKK